MRHKQQESEAMNLQEKGTRKELGKQVAVFLMICLPATWLLGWIAYDGMNAEEMVPWAYVLSSLACFMPAVAAIICCKLTKESLWNLKFMPKLTQNKKVYVLAILLGMVLGMFELIVMPLMFPKVVTIHEDATALVILLTILSAVSAACILVSWSVKYICDGDW